MDTVHIEGLKVDAMIGVFEWEHEQPQPLLIDVVMAWDQKLAAKTDDIKLALDYDAVSRAITELVQKQPRQLIETVAEDIAAMIRETFAVAWLRVKVAKPTAVKEAFQVAVQIERGRKLD
ncbi:MAG TPA: dihydroneopterin aldolase [Pseudidiomarina sp.]|nr:dihydroneopterin aldolase [Pseudidiomarina sp.]